MSKDICSCKVHGGEVESIAPVVQLQKELRAINCRCQAAHAATTTTTTRNLLLSKHGIFINVNFIIGRLMRLAHSSQLLSSLILILPTPEKKQRTFTALLLRGEMRK